MGNFIAGLFATVVTIPVLGFAAAYFLIFWITRDKKRAVRLSADITTFFFILSVYWICYQLWQVSLAWLIVLLLAASGAFFALLGWSIYKRFDVKKVTKGMWRFNFLLFAVLYFVLVLFGLLGQIWST